MNSIWPFREGFRGGAGEQWQAAVKIHTRLDLRGNIPSFIDISDGKLHDVHLLLPEAGAIYVMDRGHVDFARLHVLHLAGAWSAQNKVDDGMVALVNVKTDYRARAGTVRFSSYEPEPPLAATARGGLGRAPLV